MRVGRSPHHLTQARSVEAEAPTHAHGMTLAARLSTYRMGVSGKCTSHPIGILSTIAIQLFAVRKDWAVCFPFRPYTRRSLRSSSPLQPHATDRHAPKSNYGQAQDLAQARRVESEGISHSHGTA